MPEPKYIAPLPSQQQQPVKFDPEIAAKQQVASQLAKGEPTIQVNEQPFWQKALSTIMEPLAVPGREIGRPLYELSTSLVREIMMSEARDDPNSPWKQIVKGWDSGFAKGNSWDALQGAREAAKLQRDTRPEYYWGEKFVGDVLLDPLNLVGWGLFGQTIKGATKLGFLGRLGGPIGAGLGNLEAAYLRGTGKVFEAGGHILSKIPLAAFKAPSDITMAAAEGAKAGAAFSRSLGAFAVRNRAGDVGEYLSILANKVRLPDSEITESEAYLLGTIDRFLRQGEERTLLEEIKRGGTFPGLFSRLDVLTPQQAITEWQKDVSSKALSNIRVLRKEEWAGEAAGKLTHRWEQADGVRKLLLAATGGPNYLKLINSWNTFERWVLKGPAVAVLSYGLYSPFNALEEITRTAFGKVMPGWESDPEFFRKVFALRAPDDPFFAGLMTQEATLTEAQNIAKGIDFVPHPVSKLISWSNTLTSNLRRGALLNKFLPAATRELGSSPAYREVVEAIHTRPRGLDSRFDSRMRDLAYHYADRDADTFITSMDAHLGDTYETNIALDALLSDRGKHWSALTRRKLKASIRQLVQDGEFTAERLTQVKADLAESLFSDAAKEPEYLMQAMDGIFASVANRSITNPSDVLKAIDDISILGRETSRILRKNVRGDYEEIIIQREARKLAGGFGAVSRRHTARNTKEIEMLEHLETKMKEMGDSLTAKIKGLGISSTASQDALTAVVNQHLAIQQVNREARQLSERLIASKGSFEDQADFWEDFFIQRDNFWSDAFKNRIEPLESAADAAKRVLEKEAIGSLPADIRLAVSDDLENLADLSRQLIPPSRAQSINDELTDFISALSNKAFATKQQFAAWEPGMRAWVRRVGEEIKRVSLAERESLASKYQSALNDSISWAKRTYTDYDGKMLVDDIAQMGIPFWVYSTRALEWTLRNGIQKPAIAETFFPYGRYWEETDSGYLPASVLGFQFSPTRTMGIFAKLRRLQLPDYPAQHSGLLGGVEEAQQFLATAGLFPTPVASIFTSGVVSLQDMIAGRPVQPRFAESLPPYFTSAVNLLYFGAIAQVPNEAPLPPSVVAALNNVRKLGTLPQMAESAQALLARSPYSEMFTRRYAYETFNKAWSELSPEEEKAARAGAAMQSIFMEQTGALRYKPQSMIDARQRINEFISKESGVLVEDIEAAAKRGIPSWQISPMDREQRKRLAALEGWKALYELGTPLKDTERALLDKVSAYYYKSLDTEIASRKKDQIEEDALLQTAQLSPAVWRKHYQERWDMEQIRDGLEKGVEILAPFLRTTAERRLWAEMKDKPYSEPRMFDNLVDLWFSIKPQPDSFGREDIGKFIAIREEFLDALPDATRKKFDLYLQNNHDTDTVKEYRQGNSTFMRPYWNWEEYLPRQREAAGDSQTGSFYRSLFERVHKAEIVFTQVLQGGGTLQEAKQARSQQATNGEISMFGKLRSHFRKQLLRDNPEIEKFRNRFFPDETI